MIKDSVERGIQVKDIFVFGCLVGLRISDLLSLKSSNLERNYSNYHITVMSKKTRTVCSIKLANFAIKILQKYRQQYDTLLPPIHIYNFNNHIRAIAEKAGWTETYEKKRSKRGILQVISKLAARSNYRFCDLISSHTMRRTAITLYLSMGMPEQFVRRISGHSPTSKEFFRYVKFTENSLDNELERIHSYFKIENI